MFSTLVSVALFSLAAVKGANAQFSVATPTITQCQPVELTWTGGDASYAVLAVPPSDPCDTIADFGDHNGTSGTFTVPAPAGSTVAFLVIDSNAAEAWTNNIVIGASNDTSCLSAAQLSSIAAASSSSSSSSSVAASSQSAASATTLVVSPTGGSGSGSGPAGAVESDAPDAPNTSGAASAAGATAVGGAKTGGDSSAAVSVRPATAFVAAAVAALMFTL
jgi:hypothetical protein